MLFIVLFLSTIHCLVNCKMPFIVLTLWKLKDLGVFFYGTKEIERTQNLT